MFTADSRSEKFLDCIGAKNKYSNGVSFDDLADDWKSQQNLGRSESRVEKAVEEYRSLMDKGSAAPAPILWRNPKHGKLEPLDGKQRLLAAEQRNPTMFSAYIVETDSTTMANRIRVFANLRLQGGHQESAEWTLERAITLLVATSEMSIEDCANFGGWTIAQVRDKAQIIDIRLAVQGVGGPDRMNDSLIKVISKHCAREDFAAAPSAIAKFTNDVQKMKLSAEDAEPYVEEFFSVARNKGKLFDQFEKKWLEFRDEDGVLARINDPGRSRYQQMSPEGRIMKILRSGLTTVERSRDEGDVITGMEEFYQVVNQTKATLQQIEKYSRGKK